MFELTGQLLYSPERKGLKRSDQSHNLVLDFPQDEMSDYYQWLLEKQYGQCLRLQKPMFNLHVTVVRPQEVDLNHPLWKKYEGNQLTVKYDHEGLERHWDFWSLNVYSNELNDIRRELGLRTDFRLHITIGRQYEWQFKPLLKGVVQDTDYLIKNSNL